MRAVVQRVSEASVTVDERPVSSIGAGLLVLLGIASGDTVTEADWLLDKILDLRIFENDIGKLDCSLRDVEGELMIVSQFTLLADTRRGRRPSFTDAAPPAKAMPMCEHFVARAVAAGIRTCTGEFGAHMAVELTNDGPMTIVLDSSSR